MVEKQAHPSVGDQQNKYLELPVYAAFSVHVVLNKHDMK